MVIHTILMQLYEWHVAQHYGIILEFHGCGSETGTVYPPHCGSLTLNLDTLIDFHRHFYLAH